MTTNYLLVELTAKMEHEERLQRSAYLREHLKFRPQNVHGSWRSMLSSWRNFFAGRLADQGKTNPTTITQIPEPTAPEPVRIRPLCKNEEEWVKVFSMIQNRKLSVEQAEQLLIAMS